jgi:Zinc carboxypeptidase
MLRRTAIVLAAALLGAAAAAPANAQTAPPSACTQTLGYNPDVPTWEQFFAAHPDPDAVVPLGYGTAGAGGGAPSLGSGAPNPVGRNLTRVVYRYWDALVDVTSSDAKRADGSYVYPYQVVKKYLGKSALGTRDIAFYVISTRAHIASLDTPDGDAAFWRGVRSGEIPTDVGVESAGSRPAFAWITATPHGGESAAAEAITREAYELVARTDCENRSRMEKLTLFLQPVRNPDGRDGVTRTTAWTFDPNRDFGTQNQQENKVFVPEMNQYPGVFFIDAHQQSNGYFFPPNEDPVHHEISAFSLDFIQEQIGPALQRAFNDQSSQYQNYNSYDMFTPEYGDTVPSLIMGAAGMTYEKGNSEVYGKQVYDHYLAIDTTVNLTANDKVNILSNWVRQWGEAVQQGQNCALQPNKLVSPLHDTMAPVPADARVCGYFFKPDQHTGDTAALIDLLQKTGVRVFKLDTPVAVNGLHVFGTEKGSEQDGATLPAGTLYIPMAQGMKHWIQALLGENPYIPYDYYYDVVTWSYPLQRGLAGSGFLTKPLSPGIQMTEIHGTSYGTAPATSSPVYAFNTDSMQGIGLAADLLAKGVNVYRGRTAFDAAGKRFYTGAALVDGASLAASGANLAQLADARDTPVTGLPSYPVARYQLAVPKIGVYTNSQYIPTNPLYVTGPNVIGNSGHCALTGLPNANSPSSFCEAMFVLTQKDKLPAGMVLPVTSADLANGVLRSGNFTAFINPGSSIATTSGDTMTPAGTALRDFITNGGVYIGTNANGASAARTIGAATLNTTSIPGILTPGSTFDATFNTTNPVAWGFDLGGWIYRDSSGNAIFDPNTVGVGSSVVTFATGVAVDPEKYGYDSNAAGLASKPAIVHSEYGSGRSVLFGFNPFFRAWKEQDERLVLNAALYPLGASIPAGAPSPSTAEPAVSAADIKPASAPIPAAKLTDVARKPVTTVANVDRDVRIQVKRADAAKLKAAVKAAKLSKAVRKKLRYVTTRKTVTLVVKGARTSDEHVRKMWVSRITKGLDRRKVKPLYALV